MLAQQKADLASGTTVGFTSNQQPVKLSPK